MIPYSHDGNCFNPQFKDMNFMHPSSHVYAYIPFVSFDRNLKVLKVGNQVIQVAPAKIF